MNDTSLDIAMTQVVRRGFAFVSCFVLPGDRAHITAELQSKQFHRAQVGTGGVVQNFEHWTGPLHQCGLPILFDYGQGISYLVRQWYYRYGVGCNWFPNEVAIQRYPAGRTGIGVHRDYIADIGLVAVINLAGHATFNILAEDRHTSMAHWKCEPGDLILLAGAEAGTRYDRPVHSVTNVRDERVSIAYRMTR